MDRDKKKVLMIDDSGDDIILAKKILEKHGMTILAAYNWMEALECIESEDIDIVLLDLNMPSMNGFELLNILRKQSNCMELPVIIYTSSSSFDANDCAARGSNAYVKKYGDPKLLVNKIDEILEVA